MRWLLLALALSLGSAAYAEPPSERYQVAQSSQQAPQTFQGQLLEQPDTRQGNRQEDKADPTALTTLQLQREIQLLREVLETRLDALDKATILRQTDADKTTALRTEAIHQLQLLIEEKFRSFEEKFRSIGIQFVERDIRTEQTSRDSKVAVDAALQAAKEAVGEQNKSSALAIAKSEASTTKQIDQIQVLINSNSASLNDKIDDIKQRLTQFDGQAKGSENTIGYVFAAVGAIMLIFGGAMAILNRASPRVVVAAK